MDVTEFRDDDDAYTGWLRAHPDGYVLNIARSLNAATARVHHATCRTITGHPARGATFVGEYVKVCAPQQGDLDAWVAQHVRTPVARCGTCHDTTPRRGESAAAPVAGPPRPPVAAPAGGQSGPEAVAGAGFEVDGPTRDHPAVWLWAERPVPFDHLTPTDSAARAALWEQLPLLRPAPGEILHATYTGPRAPNADVENLLLYNIDSRGTRFATATAHGVRFEHADEEPRRAPSGRAYACCYRYRLARPGDHETTASIGRLLAAFTDAALGAFPAAKRLEQTWRAVHHARVDLGSRQFRRGERFAVLLTLTPPAGSRPAARPDLVKPLLDGAIAAFQAHEDDASLAEVSTRLAATLGDTPSEVARMLQNGDRAVLGSPGWLVYLFGNGVKWNPDDHNCTLGELTISEPAGGRWLLSGRIHALPDHGTARGSATGLTPVGSGDGPLSDPTTPGGGP